MAKIGKISQKTGKIFVLRIILSDRKISVKNLAIFCVLTYLPAVPPVRTSKTGTIFFQESIWKIVGDFTATAIYNSGMSISVGNEILQNKSYELINYVHLQTDLYSNEQKSVFVF